MMRICLRLAFVALAWRVRAFPQYHEVHMIRHTYYGYDYEAIRDVTEPNALRIKSVMVGFGDLAKAAYDDLNWFQEIIVVITSQGKAAGHGVRIQGKLVTAMHLFDKPLPAYTYESFDFAHSGRVILSTTWKNMTDPSTPPDEDFAILQPNVQESMPSVRVMRSKMLEKLMVDRAEDGDEVEVVYVGRNYVDLDDFTSDLQHRKDGRHLLPEHHPFKEPPHGGDWKSYVWQLFGEMDDLNIHQGIIVRKFENSIHCWEYRSNLLPGMSGTGVFTWYNEAWWLVGIHMGALGPQFNTFHAIPDEAELTGHREL